MGSVVIRVENLPFDMTESDLEELLPSFVEVNRMRFGEVKDNLLKKGYVEITNETLVQYAIDELDGKEVNGRVLRVSIERNEEVTNNRRVSREDNRDFS